MGPEGGTSPSTLGNLDRQGNIPPMPKRELADRSGPCRCRPFLQRLGSRVRVERCPSHHRTTSVQTTKARLPAGEQTAVLGPRPPTVTLCLAPPALNEFQSADDRPARHYRRRRGGPPGLGRDATTTRPYSISSSTSTCHDGRPACIPLCGRRRRPLFSSPTPGYVLRAPDRRLPSGASPIFLGLAFDFSHTPKK